ncbi:MAG: glycosyltransferase family 4 protein [Candidatus Heimdallarchaeaceae archaeon]
MKVSILTPDLSGNCLGRAWVLAKLLKNDFEVEILGPIFKNGIWEPLKDVKDIKITELPKPSLRNIFKFKSEIKKRINGNLIYASKPLFTSFGFGLISKKYNKVPVILDIDDWQMGFVKGSTQKLKFLALMKFLVLSLFSFIKPSNYWNSLIYEKLISQADEITVSNTFLQKKFGGTIIPHCRDPEELNPMKYTGEKIRKKYNLKNKKVVSFIGTPTKYKGVEDIIEALALIEDDDLYFMIVGLKDVSYHNYIKSLGKEKLGNRFIPLPPQSFVLLPELLAASDIVVIPQRERFETIGQLPAKIFDAMAMGKAIIATEVNDIPIILKDAGWVIPPSNIEKLKEALLDALNSPIKVEEFGKRVRERCINEYSYSVLEKKLVPIIKKAINN